MAGGRGESVLLELGAGTRGRRVGALFIPTAAEDPLARRVRWVTLEHAGLAQALGETTCTCEIR